MLGVCFYISVCFLIVGCFPPKKIDWRSRWWTHVHGLVHGVLVDVGDSIM